MRRIHAAGLNLIKSHEGCRLTAYRDVAGVWTIGYGSTGPHVRAGLTITQEQADALLRQDVGRFASGVERLLAGAPTTGNQFSAMVSLAYNIGLGAFARSTVLRQHRAGHRLRAAAAFLLWIKGGRPRRSLRGLIRRRSAERTLYLAEDA